MEIGQNPRADFLAILTLSAASAAVLFFHLGCGPVQLWDEARIAINAVEMMAARNPLIVTFHGQPDIWNTKPPLETWLVALSMKLGGLNELALRLPTAVAALCTVFVVFAFTRWASRSRCIALLAGLILLGTGGYVEAHVARTAEPDTLLILFITIATFSLIRSAAEPVPEKVRDFRLYVAAAALAAAMLAKGIAAFLMLPGYALAVLVTGKSNILRSRGTLFGAIVLVIVGISYWGARELAGSGYVAAVWHNEIARYVRRDGDGAWYFYLLRLAWPWQLAPFYGFRSFLSTSSAFPWSLMALAFAPLVATAPDPRIRFASIFLLCSLFGFVAVISLSAARNTWYSAPAYPMIAVLVALGAADLARRLATVPGSVAAAASTCLLPVSFALAILSIGFVIWKNEQVAALDAKRPEHRLGVYLRDTASFLPRDRPIRVVFDTVEWVPAIRAGRLRGAEPYTAPTEFYVAKLEHSGYDVELVHYNYRATRDDLIVGCEPRPSWTNGWRILNRRTQCFVLAKS